MAPLSAHSVPVLPAGRVHSLTSQERTSGPCTLDLWQEEMRTLIDPNFADEGIAGPLPVSSTRASRLVHLCNAWYRHGTRRESSCQMHNGQKTRATSVLDLYHGTFSFFGD